MDAENSSSSSSNSRELLLRLWHERISSHKGSLALVLVLMAVVSATAAAYPLLIQHVFDGLGEADPDIIWTIPPLIIAITFIKGLAMYFQVRQVTALSLTVTTSIQKVMAAHLIRADLAVVTAQPAGEFVSRLMNDVQLIREALVRLANNLVRDVLMVVAMVGMMIWFDWLLTIVVLVVYPIAMQPILAIGRRQRRQSGALQEQMAAMTSLLAETLQSSRMVRAYSLEDHETNRTATGFTRLRENLLKLALGRARIDPILEVLGGIAVAGVIAIAGWRVAEGEMQVGDVAGFITALLMLVQPIRGIGTLNAIVQEAVAALERIFGLLDTAPKIVTPPHPQALNKPEGVIRFDGVSFQYGDVPALDGVSFEARPGQVVALVGPSGAGKTTVINLVPRFHDTSQGVISLDDVPVTAVDLADLRGAIALVSQEQVLFDDTIANNIRLGRLGASNKEVETAARSAAAHEFITAQPKGYNTRVGEGGNKLSGGQRQRIAIARAILKDAPVLLLDEATSALDSESEQQIQAALDDLTKGRTTLVVAHRLATVQKADLILVMDKGQIVESGTHAKLSKQDGLYARLSALQHFSS
jgi:subfamily B ATP-binding cassette protein MsbA